MLEENLERAETLTRLAELGTLSRSAGEGLPGIHHKAPLPHRVWTGEIVDGCSGTWLTHPIGIFGLLGRGRDAVVGEVDHVAAA